MTYQSTWRQLCGGAKLALGAAVVAGVMAFSATGQAATTTFGITAEGGFFVGSGSIIPLSVGDHWNITVATTDANGTQNVGFLATESLQTVSTTVQNPQADDEGEDPAFNFAQAGWFDDPNDFTTGEFFTIPQVGDLFLTTSIAATVTKYLVFDWSGGINPRTSSGQVSLDTNLAAIPVPAGLILFLSGLAGIGFLGRYKAKRREPAVV